MKKLLALIVLFLILLFAVHRWWSYQISPVSTDSQTKSFIISKGQGVSEIADRLKNENLIHSSLAFKLLIRQENLSSKIQAGTFKLSPSMSTEEIVKNLINGTSDVWVTLIEGWRIEEMAAKLTQDLNKNSEEFVGSSKEGYMFPDTYLFPKEISMQQIAKIMRDNFEKKYSDELKSKIKANGLSDAQGVILASIVEREARSEGARTQVASILLKRFKIGMGLNADATIQYALGFQPSEKSWWKKNLTKDDLKVNSPYNTYIHQGLPPTPICNPGLASLQAVANANPNTPYLYYYHDSKGNSYYGKTLEEHNTNVANHP